MVLNFDVHVIDAINTSATSRITRFELKIVVENGDDYRAWHLSKRFREFAELHTQLLRRFGSGGLPHLPPKTVLKKYDAVFVTERREALDTYIKDLASREYILNCPTFRSFVEFQQNVPNCKAYSVRCLQQFSEKYQLHFDPPVDFKSGCKFTVYDLVVVDDYTMVTCCGDDSSISRLDTYLNKFRLPWEPEIKNLYNGSVNLWVRTRQKDTDRRYDQVHKDVPKIAWAMIESQATALAYDTVTRKLFVGDSNGQILVYSVAHDKKALALLSTCSPVHNGRITSMVVHCASGKLYTAGYDKIVSVFSTENYQFLGKVSTGSSWISHMVFSKSENRLYCGNYGQKVVELDVTDKSSAPDYIGEHNGHSGSVRCLEPDDTGKILYSGGFDNCICVWNVDDDRPPRLVDKWANPASDYKIKSIAWAPSIQCLISGGDSGFVHLWNAEKGKCRFSWRAHNDSLQKLVWRDETNILVTTCTDGSMKVWHLPDPSRPPEQRRDEHKQDEVQSGSQLDDYTTSDTIHDYSGDKEVGSYLLETDSKPKVSPQTLPNGSDRPRYLFSRRFYSNLYFSRLVRYRQQRMHGVNNARMARERKVRAERTPNLGKIARHRSLETQMLVLSPRLTAKRDICSL